MPKMRGFLRSKPKIDQAEWEIAQIRTAARLGDMFGSDGSAPGKEAASSKEGEETAVDVSSIIVGPGPWPGGTRPPIIVVGVSEVASVLAQGGAVEPQAAAGEAEAAPVDEVITPAKPIGVMGESEPDDRADLAALVMVEHEVTPAKPIGVMARADEIVGEDGWRLPTPAVPEPGVVLPPAAAAADPGVSRPAAAHVFPTRPTPRPEQTIEAAAPEPPSGTPARSLLSKLSTLRATSGGASATPTEAQAKVEPQVEAVRVPRRRSSAARSVAPSSAPGGTEAPKRAGRTKARPTPAPEPVREAPAMVTVAPAAAAVAPAKTTVAPAKAAVAPAKRAAVAHPKRAGGSGARRTGSSSARRRAATNVVPAPVRAAYCPYCATLLEPVPTASRRCDRCRQRIVVKRMNGAAVYLTVAAVLVFEAERQRLVNSVRWTRDRDRWLRLASTAGAPAERQAQLAGARLSADVVAAARQLYLTTVDRAFRTARHDHDWEEASRLRRDQAAVLYRVAGSPMPPPPDVIGLFREGVAAELRGVAEISRDAELVSARCCETCRSDDRLVCRITQELRAPRLPHAGCSKGLCRCRWDVTSRDRLTMRRYLRRRPGAEARLAQAAEPVVEPVRS